MMGFVHLANSLGFLDSWGSTITPLSEGTRHHSHGNGSWTHCYHLDSTIDCSAGLQTLFFTTLSVVNGTTKGPRLTGKGIVRRHSSEVLSWASYRAGFAPGVIGQVSRAEGRNNGLRIGLQVLVSLHTDTRTSKIVILSIRDAP